MRPPKIWMIFSLAVLTAAAGLHAAAAQSASPGPAAAGQQPAVLFPEKSFQFATVIEGAKVVHPFTVMNKGSAPLLISNVRTS